MTDEQSTVVEDAGVSSHGAGNSQDTRGLSRHPRTSELMLRGVLSNWLAVALTGAVSLVLTPLLVSRLGDFYFGLWCVVASFLDYYGVLDLGLRITLQRFVGRFAGADRPEDLDGTLSSALTLVLGVACLVVCCAALLAPFVPQLLRVPLAERRLCSELVFLVGLAAAATAISKVLGSFLCGLSRFDLFNLGSIVTVFLRALLFVAVLMLGYGPLALALITLGLSLLSIPLNAYLLRVARPETQFTLRFASRSRIRELLSFGLCVLASSVGDQLRFNASTLVVARFLGAALVTPFNVATRLIEYFKLIIYAVVGPLLPAMSELEGRSEPHRLRVLFLYSTKITALMSFGMAGFLTLNGKALITAWLGERLSGAYTLLVVLLCGYAIALAQSPTVGLLYARGHQRFLAWLTAAEGVVNVALSVLLVGRYGLIGVAVGTTIPMLVTKCAIQPLVALRTSGVSSREYLAALGRPVVAAAAFLLLGAAMPIPRPVSLIGLCWTAAWQAGLFTMLAYSLGFTAYERADFRSRCAGLVASVRRGSIALRTK